MIITQLNGGLGNQMFQYAAGRALALRNQAQLLIDKTSFDNQHPDDTPREYDLECFALQAAFVDPRHLKLAPSSRKGHWAEKIGVRPPHTVTTIREQGFPVNTGVLSAPDDVYLVGYWQSERYFIDQENQIRKDFSFAPTQDKANKDMSAKIKASNSISLHVRRGDYVTNKNATQFHGLSPIDYYKTAIAEITKKVTKPHFFVFSDDIGWCKENLPIPSPVTFVEINSGKQSFEDMRLMSQCKHNIIANSSFSWWGAWLNPHEDKIVYAPQRWFNDPSVDTRDVIPHSWVKL